MPPFLRRPGSTAEFERANTWLPTIVEACLTDPEWVQEGDERKYKGTGGLSINMRGRGWCDHGAGVGGISAIALVMHLKKYSYTQAVDWLIPFLKENKGTGPCGVSNGGGVDDDDATPAYAADCQEALDHLQEDLAGTVSEVYLKSRALPGPYPAGLLGHLDNARLGESALVAKIVEHDRVTGVMLTFLTPTGEKSLVEPVRRRFNLERSPGGVFRIPAPDPAAKLDAAADYLGGEGVEDALSLALLGRNLTVLGLPGIGTLPHLDLPKGAKVTFFKDGDDPDSAAAKALIAGIDAQLLKGCQIRVTETPLGFDANLILQKQSPEALRKFAARPPEATLSYNGHVIELSLIDPGDRARFAQKRAAIHKIFKVSVKDIDEDLNKLRPPPAAVADEAADASGIYEPPTDPE